MRLLGMELLSAESRRSVTGYVRPSAMTMEILELSLAKISPAAESNARRLPETGPDQNLRAVHAPSVSLDIAQEICPAGVLARRFRLCEFSISSRLLRAHFHFVAAPAAFSSARWALRCPVRCVNSFVK